jgi:hypothetical protein
MSTANTAGTPYPRPQRHALGLPAGSIRALLALGVLALLWAIALRPGQTGGEGQALPPKLPLVFVYLNMLMILVLVHFFTAHGKTIGAQVSGRSPLGLPRGSVRFILIAGYLGLAYFLYKTHPEFEAPQTAEYALPMALLLSGYLLGHIISGTLTHLGGGVPPAWYQDFEAWIALLAVIGLGIIVIVRLFINTTLPMEDRLDVQLLETILAAVIGFYFGARS